MEVETGRTATVSELCAARVGSALAQHGPLHGRRILLGLPPGIPWIESFVGIVRAGAVVVPLPLGAPAAELAYFASDSGATLAVADEERAAKMPAGMEVIDPEETLSSFRKPTSSAPAPAGPTPSADDVAMLLYTSGTTGKPKGARITHANLAAQTAALREAWGMRASDTLLHALPMHHLHGIVVAMLTALTTPCRVRMLSKFDAARVIEELPRSTVLMAVPTMYQRILDAADALDVPARQAFATAARSLRLATSGSAALPVVLAERWRSYARAIPLERYGMTEIGMALSNPLDPSGRRAGTVGRPLPSVEVRIVGEDGAPAESGELWVRGPSVFAGYHERDEATREAFKEGWFMTGDVATRDEAGSFRLLGRSSVDILKSGGEKVSALEIEESLLEHAAIREVAVVGLPDAEWGDRVTAAVVLAPGSVLGIAELRAWCKDRLAPYKVPRSLVILEALPRNAMGKVEKKVLVETISRNGGLARAPTRS
ncbi:MAG: AMP-binding protein [Polyangiaceae bacterium]|nr:AMP-binding protein [Polyangiaceae bacterium]